jgi:hypothetical protein
MKVGDKVIVTKNISKIYNVKAIITYINDANRKGGFYRVKLTENQTLSGGDSCNIFCNHTGESIELDLQEIRNDKLKKLGI